MEAWAGDADAGPGHGHGHGHECAGDGQTDEYGHECPGYSHAYAGYLYGNEYQDPAYGDEYIGPGDAYASAAGAGWGMPGVPICVGQITDAPMIVGVMLRRVKVYGEMKTGHPVGELAKGEQVEILRIYPPDVCGRFWGEIAGGRYVVVDGARGRRVRLLIGVENAD